MRVALINPQSDGTKVKPWLKRFATFHRVTFPILAAYTPKDIELEVFDENVEKIDFEKEFGVVGITVMTPAFDRAKEISDIFRKKGSTVVWGGIHPTVRPEESKNHADIIVRGVGELAWEQILKDYQKNELLSEYIGQQPTQQILPNRQILQKKSLMSIETVETSRGCPSKCTYCSVPVFNNGKFSQFSIDSVIEDIQSIDGKYILFVDDNLIGNKNYAKELFGRMKGLGKKWLSQSPIYIAEDEELLKLAAESGCMWLYLGIESISQESLSEANKKRNKIEKYQEYIKKIHDYGIAIEGGFIFGFDNETTDIFPRTMDFIDRVKIDSPNFHILTPYPGTPLYDELNANGRIIHTDWSKYNTANVVFHPKNMTSEQLQEEYVNIHKEVYGWKSIMNRTINSNQPHYTFLVNATIKLGAHTIIKP